MTLKHFGGKVPMIKRKVTLLNMISGLVLQLCAVVSGFIIPKVILTYFGSEANGLVASINQFLSYITLVEGGITGIVCANLYKPIVDKNNEKICSILKTANSFFRKIGIIFACYTIVLGAIYPIIFKTGFSWTYVFTLTVIMAWNLLIQYMFSLTLRTFLNADKKSYIVNFTQVVITILNIGLTILSVNLYPSIHLMKFINGFLYIIQPIIYSLIIKREYNFKVAEAKKDNSLIKERWNGFAINIAAFMHNSTDITILTIFSTLQVVSIYSVYLLVVNGVKGLTYSCFSGISHSVGQAYARNDLKELNEKLDLYEYIVFTLVSFIFTVTCLLITPFVLLYTEGINDANYNQPIFGILLVVSEALYLIKLPHLDLAYSANKFKEITIPAYIEAGLNIVISITLVRAIGLIGVAIGTIIGMLYRMMFHVYYTSKIIENRPQIVFYKKFLGYTIASVLSFMLCINLFPFDKINISSWIMHGVIYSIIVGALLLFLSLLAFKKELRYFKNYVKK